MCLLHGASKTIKYQKAGVEYLVRLLFNTLLERSGLGLKHIRLRQEQNNRVLILFQSLSVEFSQTINHSTNWGQEFTDMKKYHNTSNECRQMDPKSKESTKCSYERHEKQIKMPLDI